MKSPALPLYFALGLAVAVCVPMLGGAPESVSTPSTRSVMVSGTTDAVVFPASRQLVQTFTAATKAATVPLAVGQLGWETDTGALYRATSTTAGAWASAGGSGSIDDATETTAGKAELATTSETQTGTDDARIVTPLKLFSVLSDEDSSARLVSNGSGGFRLELWNGTQSKYQEVRLAGAVGAERLVIAP